MAKPPTIELVNNGALSAEHARIVQEALWWSVRSMPCGGIVHIYGNPARKLKTASYEPGFPLWLKDKIEQGGRCSRDSSRLHLTNYAANLLGSLVNTPFNTWGDRLDLP